MTISIGTANWKKWLQIKRAELWEAVCLSLNLEPHHGILGLKNMDCEPEDPLYFYARDFNERLLIAERSLGANGGLKSLSTVVDDPARALVSLPAFGAWAESKWNDLPDKFPREDENAEVAKSWPWGSHETKLLRHMASAAHEWWSTYDPDKQTTAPTNKEVAAWLETQGVGNRVAKIMAQILRADGLRSGRRK